ncbi:MAG: endonuclease/exonuclease/phosphatase family protein [Fibrobacterales bacterium]
MKLILALSITLLILNGCLFSDDNSSTSPPPKTNKSIQTLNTSIPQDTLRVASLNMAIGFNLTTLFGATNIELLYGKIQTIYAEYDSSMANARIGIMADSILHYSPDVVALQEVLYFERHGIDTTDFLNQLLDSLNVKSPSPPYSATLHQLNPFAFDTLAFDTIPLKFMFAEGNAFLYKQSITKTQEDTFSLPTRVSFPYLNTTLSSIRAVHQASFKKGNGPNWQLNNTHFEVFNNAPQAEELLLFLDSSYISTSPQLVLGDLNSKPGAPAHAMLMSDDGFFDLWESITSSKATYGIELRDPTSTLTEQLDYVLARNYLTSIHHSIHPLGPEIRDGVSLSAADHAFILVDVVAQ